MEEPFCATRAKLLAGVITERTPNGDPIYHAPAGSEIMHLILMNTDFLKVSNQSLEPVAHHSIYGPAFVIKSSTVDMLVALINTPITKRALGLHATLLLADRRVQTNALFGALPVETVFMILRQLPPWRRLSFARSCRLGYQLVNDLGKQDGSEEKCTALIRSVRFITGDNHHSALMHAYVKLSKETPCHQKAALLTKYVTDMRVLARGVSWRSFEVISTGGSDEDVATTAAENTKIAVPDNSFAVVFADYGVMLPQCKNDLFSTMHTTYCLYDLKPFMLHVSSNLRLFSHLYWKSLTERQYGHADDSYLLCRFLCTAQPAMLENAPRFFAVLWKRCGPAKRQNEQKTPVWTPPRLRQVQRPLWQQLFACFRSPAPTVRSYMPMGEMVADGDAIHPFDPYMAHVVPIAIPRDADENLGEAELEALDRFVTE